MYSYSVFAVTAGLKCVAGSSCRRLVRLVDNFRNAVDHLA